MASRNSAHAHGVSLHSDWPQPSVVSCEVCNHAWSPTLRTSGYRPWRWWACPNGCNT
jgi:hypothetical protein